MPLYAYECCDCGETFDVRAFFKEKEVGLDIVCPKCGCREVRLLLTAAMVIQGGKVSGASTRCNPNSGSGCCG